MFFFENVDFFMTSANVGS